MHTVLELYIVTLCVVVFTMECDQCEDNPKAGRCEDCELNYCLPCWEVYHKKVCMTLLYLN